MLTRDATRGTGLGLYISKLLSEQMGGHSSLDHSKVGEGTTFSFALPLATGGPVVPTTTTPKPATPSEPSADSSAKPATAAAAQPVKVKTKTTKAATKAKE
ncbi:MAG TPA: ATP-binding protein, partial [Candidatus Saccharimonas sp.]|nr:ATP-binding protein [Candidatus Saccharimonas sp.]